MIDGLANAFAAKALSIAIAQFQGFKLPRRSAAGSRAAAQSPIG